MWGVRVRLGWAALGLVLVAACADDGSPALTGSSGGSEDTAADTVTSLPPTTADTSSGGSSSGGADETSSTTGPPEPGAFEECYADAFVGEPLLPDYDNVGVNIASHCLGSDHQDIDDVERVVFLGDSVTVGTPPTALANYYRNLLADMLADRFALSFGANKGVWQAPNLISGQALAIHSGDFSACAEWGARNDDLLAGMQIEQCFTEEQRQLKTLTIITSGGNDLAALARDAGDGVPLADLVGLAAEIVDYKREAVEWLTDPANFPNGSFVVFGNIYEFTDSTAEFQGCDLSGLAGFDQPLPVPEQALSLVTWLQEQYGDIALTTGSDFIFMYEEFCGHGFEAGNPEAPCYRGPGMETWFDLTCIHPTAVGHNVLADMFLATVSE